MQNIRAYESERRTVEELRRLSALRADFVSLVSHELRSPMAAVIGASRTLEQRWRELSPSQREAFLALIADETTRLAALIGDVLDTSRIDAGTFTYRFGEVDVGGARAGLRCGCSSVAQDEVTVNLDVAPGVPPVRGDAERLRQVLVNLIENAVKYSPAGERVDVRITAADHAVTVSVQDRGPGIASRGHRLIFEKFGRVASGSAKPGTGLGLYIARSIAEAHGGTLERRVGPRPRLDVHVALAGGLSPLAQRPQLGGELAGAVRDARAQFRRVEHDRLAAVRDDFADEPVGAADRLLGDRRAVDERARALLDFPARDRRRVPDARLGGVVQLGRVEAFARHETSCAAPSRGACGRGDTSAAGRGRRPSVCTYQYGSRRSIEYGSIVRVTTSCSSGLRYSISTSWWSSIACVSEPTRSSSSPTCGSGVCDSSNCAERLLELAPHVRKRVVRAGGRPSARRTRARAGSRAPRAASGAAARRKVSPNSSLSTCTSSPCSSA